jgi:hypothetical protein
MIASTKGAFVLNSFCSNKADHSMTQDDNNITVQTTENSSLNSTDQTGGKQPAGVKAQSSNLANKVSEIEKELAHISARLPKEVKTVASNALDLANHPSRYAELGASLAEGMAGESLGETLGAGLGTVFGPEGTVIGAELGGLVGEVFGARQGSKIAKELVHQAGTEHPLKEDLQKGGSAKIGSHAGKIIGGMIGDVLFDDAGGEIGEEVGDKIGYLAGNIAFEHVTKMHVKNNDEPCPEDVSQTNTDES